MHVLVVDDEPSVRAVVRRALDEGVTVTEAPDAAAAFAVLSEQRVDAVVLDVMLPEMDGFEVLGRIRATLATADIPVVMLTALTTEGDHVRGFRGGADAYLTKPFDVDQLAAVVQEVVGRSAAERTEIRQRELGRAELLHHLEAQFRF